MSEKSDEEDVRRLMPRDLADLYVPIHKMVLSHHSKWEIFRQLYADSDESVQIVYRTASVLFTHLRNLLFFDVLLTFSNLTETDTKMTFTRLVKIFKKHAPHSVYEEVKQDLDELTTMCEPFKEWRNKLIAHKDLDLILGGGTSLLPRVNRQKIDAANEKMGEMLNKIRITHKLNFTLFTPVMSGDGRALISALKRAEIS